MIDCTCNNNYAYPTMEAGPVYKSTDISIECVVYCIVVFLYINSDSLHRLLLECLLMRVFLLSSCLGKLSELQHGLWRRLKELNLLLPSFDSLSHAVLPFFNFFCHSLLLLLFVFSCLFFFGGLPFFSSLFNFACSTQTILGHILNCYSGLLAFLHRVVQDQDKPYRYMNHYGYNQSLYCQTLTVSLQTEVYDKLKLRASS